MSNIKPCVIYNHADWKGNKQGLFEVILARTVSNAKIVNRPL